MKIMLWSDLHAHPWSDLSELDEEGVNTRLRDSIKVIESLNDICVRENIKTRIFGGDLYHKRNEIDVTTQSLLLDNTFGNDQLDTEIFLTGNHDLALNTRYHSMKAFEAQGVNVIDHPSVVELRTPLGVSFKVSFHPWDDDRLRWREKYIELLSENKDTCFSVMHYDFKDISYRGMKIGEGSKTSLLVPNIPAFSGHYHDHVDYGSVVYIGSPLQHNWGDREKIRGYIVAEIDDSTGKFVDWEHRTLESAPEFLEVARIQDLDNYELAGNFVKVVSKTFLSDKEKASFTKIFEASGVRAHRFYEKGVKIDREDLLEERVSSKAFDPSQVLSDYLEEAETDLNKKRLKKIGSRLLH